MFLDAIRYRVKQKNAIGEVRGVMLFSAGKLIKH
jgi:hypothetical protein